MDTEAVKMNDAAETDNGEDNFAEAGCSNRLPDGDNGKKEQELKHKQTGALVLVSRISNIIYDMMADEKNLHLVKSEFEKFNSYAERYRTSHLEFCKVLTLEYKVRNETQLYEQKFGTITQFMGVVIDWIYKAEQNLLDECDRASTKRDHASNAPSSRSSNSKMSARAKESARLAELLVEQEMFEKQQEIDRRQHELECQAQKLKLQTKIAKAKAREKAYASVGSTHGSCNGDPMNDLVSSNNGITGGARSKLGTAGVLPQWSVYPSKSNIPLTGNLLANNALVSSGNNAMNYPRPATDDLNNQYQLNAGAVPFKPRQINHTPDFQGDNNLITTNTLLAALSLPQPEVPKFSGDMMNYATFMNAFDSRVASRVASSADKLYYLDQHLLNEPKEVISGCLHMNPDQGYVEARRLLDKEYGDPYKLSMLYLKKMKEWPFIKQNDHIGLKQFSLFLTKCKIAMQQLSYLCVLNDPNNLQCIWQKFPFYLQNKWSERVSKARRVYRKELTYYDMVDFIAEAADAANDPVYGKMVTVTGYNSEIRKPKVLETTKMRSKASSFSAVSAEDNSEYVTKCPFCSKSHDLDNCGKFKCINMSEKREFIKDKRLCFGCYSKDHFSRGCLKKLSCKICGKLHPTTLHIENFQLVKKSPATGQNERSKLVSDLSANLTSVKTDNLAVNNQETSTSVCTATDVSDAIVLHAILPVRLYQKGSDRYVSTYCFYDNGSSSCFITTEIYEQLGISGTNTRLQLKTMHGCTSVSSIAVSDLLVTDFNGSNPIALPRTYTQEEIPVSSHHIPTPQLIRKWNHLEQLAVKIPEYIPGIGIGILIGSNCPAALEPLEVVSTKENGPFATRLRHGWTVCGSLQLLRSGEVKISSNLINIRESERIKELLAPDVDLNTLELNLNDNKTAIVSGECGMSREDTKFLDIVERNIVFTDGQYVVPLPFRNKEVSMPNNKVQALKRVEWQRKTMIKSEQYHMDYRVFMQNLLDKNYAELVPSEQIAIPPGKVWYLPHHGVYNPNKPGKIRVVFDCSAKFLGTSLNDQLLQGPDMTNSLIGVLMRFRHEKIAFSGDVESMFYRVRVPADQRKYLRFLWWPNGDLQYTPAEYQMNVHIFGAVSSPSIANYVLRKIGVGASNPLVMQTIHRNFYVDDCLKFVSTSECAVKLIKELCSTFMQGGFRLTKFLSNSSDVLCSIPLQEQAAVMQTIDLHNDHLPLTRALGIQWCVKPDQFGFTIMIKEGSYTRRGILSVVSSLYDPLGFVAPVILPAKQILQDLCKEKHFGWDDRVPDEFVLKFNQWLYALPELENISIDRCFKHGGFGPSFECQLHVFADASSNGYGSVAYLRLSDYFDAHKVSFVAGKARLAPLKSTTIPRLELTAAVTAVTLAAKIKQEMDMPMSIRYYTDSSTVLRYISNEHRRFPVYVANRVQVIRNFTEPTDWYHVASALNPADEASRGLTPKQLIDKARWLKGPEFLRHNEESWPDEISQRFVTLLGDYDDDADAQIVCAANVSLDMVSLMINYFSDWHRLKRAVAVFLKTKKILHDRVSGAAGQSYTIAANDLEEAEIAIIRWIQHEVYEIEIKQISSSRNSLSHLESKRSRVPTVSKSSSLYKLSPYLDRGVLRVGGRLSRASVPDHMKHPFVLPRKHHVTTLIIRHVHQSLGHAGRNHVLSELINKYWIVGGNSAVRHVLYNCVKCRRMRGPTQEQKMADLPLCRLDGASPPFHHTGVDYFGPFLVKDGRKEVKRYGVLFTCMTSRAVHLEVADSLETDTFINVLRRFIARRGNIRSLYSDNGTNFSGAERELRLALEEMNQHAVNGALIREGIDWTFNPPAASHMGGVWERMIRTVRKVLMGLLQEHGTRLDTDSFHTLLCEIEAIINSRPITNVSGDPDDLQPLTPNHLLTGRSVVTGPPPGVFQSQHVYMRRRWKRVQYLANLFWSRWKNEYMLLLQSRQKKESISWRSRSP